MIRSLLVTVATVALFPTAAWAADPQPASTATDSAVSAASGTTAADSNDAPAPDSAKGTQTKNNQAIVITGRRLDVARDSITPSLGASQYTFDQEALKKQPGGTNITLN
jgi:hypothetical protein